MKNYILTENGNNTMPLAIITEKNDISLFWDLVRLAIAENSAMKAEDVDLFLENTDVEDTDTPQHTFEAQIGDDLNGYYLTEVLTY